MARSRAVALLFSTLSILILSTSALAQAPILITQTVDESKLVTLAGNTRPEATAKNDRGVVSDTLLLDHMLLQLKRSPQQERALRQYIDSLQNRHSPNYHHWLTAKQFGKRFGLATQDLGTITQWLESYGFKVNVVYDNGVLIDFSGTAGQVRAAFHTEIHQLDVKGEKHIANMSDPRIPAALAPAMVGVVSLNDFKPHTNYKSRPDYTFSGCGPTCYAVVPGDLATIYNLNPLFTAGTSGQGQTIVVVEDTDLYTTADWNTFRSTFGLSSYTAGTLTQVHPAPPSGTNNCIDPGVNGDDGEAIIDAEYASAAAPSAAIQLAACEDTTTFGGLIAIQNLLNESGTPPAIISMSYGECEAGGGAALNAAFSTAFQQAVTESVSVFVSAGDSGAASCDQNDPAAYYGIGVSGWASSPYNVAVGGTDFGDSYEGTNSTYWNASNSSTYESALSYVPEIPWNDSCASVLAAQYLTGSSLTYGTAGLCNNTNLINEYGLLTTAAGSGGPSACATGSPAVLGVVGGTCAGWPKPTWQSGSSLIGGQPVYGMPNDGVRDLPDVSLFAANGVWGHFYLFCYSDPNNGGVPCTGAPDNWSGAGGTSFASPIMAGIQALVNQSAGGAQGNPNPIYYQLAANEYGASGSTSCNSTLGNAAGSSCVFYDVTLGDMDVNCAPYSGNTSYNCYYGNDPNGNGVLSTSSASYQPAYGTTTGWDFATGIGSVNATNLVNAWASANLYPTTTTLQSSENPSKYGDSVTFTATVTTSGTSTPTGKVTFMDGSATIGTGTLVADPGVVNSATATYATSALAPGTHSITGVYGGDSNNSGSTSSAVSQVVNAPTFTVSNPTTPATVLSGQSSTSTFTVTATGTGVTTFAGNVTFACNGLPDATVTCSFLDQHGNSQILAGTSSPDTVTLTITTTGPNPNDGVRKQINRRRADNRMPWLPMTLPLAGVVMMGIAGRKRSRYSMAGALCVSLALLGLLIACGGSSTPPVVGISVSPTASTLFPNDTADNWPPQTAIFTATVSNSSNTGVNWQLSSRVSVNCTDPSNPCGTIAAGSGNSVTYTAPTIASGLPGTVTLTATAQADTTKTATAGITLTPTTVPGTYPLTVTGTESTTQVVSNSFNLTVQ